MRKYFRLLRLAPDQRRRAVVKLAARAFHEDHGGEVLEYSLVAGLIVVASITTIQCIGGKVVARWNSINAAM